MFRSNLATYPYFNPINSNTYGKNLGLAARAFIAALFAKDPIEQLHAAPSQATPLAADAHGVQALQALANHFDDIMPNQAAELRYLAGSID